MEKETPFVYSQKVIDLITVAAEFCRRMEQCGEDERTAFVDAMRALLPMLYLKTTLLGPVPETAGYSAASVAEADYEYVRSQAAALMGEMDTYLDTFVDDFKYSETPVLRTVSEGLADVYQAMRNLVETFRHGFEDAMQAALAEALGEFELSWGQTLLNTLRALHDVRYGGRTV